MSTLPATKRRIVHRHRKPSIAKSRGQEVLGWLRPLGSLKVAVVSFALAIVLILIGTLAQVNRDIWEVLEVYFKVWWTWVDVSILFPRSWLPRLEPVSAIRLFVAGTMAGCMLAGLLTWSNSAHVRGARPLAIGTVTAGTVLSISALWRGGFWYPGGALIGAVMAVNLVAAHATRYRIQARGARFVGGLVVTAMGILVTLLVIVSGHNSSGFQGEPPLAWTTLWQAVKTGLSFAAAGLLLFALFGKAKQRLLRPMAGGIAIVLGAIATWLWATGHATYLGDSGMRVLWQLILALLAAGVLLSGSLLLFRQRAGVIVLHAGIGLMMFGQWFVTRYDAEEQMTMVEGQTLNYGQDIRSVELAVVRRNSSEFPGHDDVYAIPLTLNGDATQFLNGKKISDERLPFDIEIVDFQKSSSVVMNRGEAGVPSDAGRNQGFRIVPTRPASGTMGSSVDLASGYFRVVNKETRRPLGTYLLSQEVLGMRNGQHRAFDLETIPLDDHPVDLQLRFVRNYKDYSMQLIDVRKDDYLGTSIPRNYSSRVRLTDPSRNVDQELTIWMNNPRRYAGETFYQSGWQQDSQRREYTTLQVVRNYGWMIPYVACMITVVGMGCHFLFLLLRFLDRQSRPESWMDQDGGFDDARVARDPASIQRIPWGRRVIIPLSIAAVFALLMGRLATPPHADPGEMDLYQFGQLPLVYQGRVKPFDTLARNSLRAVADSETFKGVLPPAELAEKWPQAEQELKEQFPELKNEDLSAFKRGDIYGLIQRILSKTDADVYRVTAAVETSLLSRQPAVRWLLDVITGSEQARRHKVIRIYHPQVLDLLGLQRRKYYRYSLEEIAPRMDAFHQQAQQAYKIREKDVEQLSLYQKKLLETDHKIRSILMLHAAFSPPDLPDLPTLADFQGNETAARSKLDAFRQAMAAHEKRIGELQPPLAIAPLGAKTGESEGQWQAYSAIWPRQLVTVRVLGDEPQPSFKALNDVMLAYLDQDASRFNEGVDNYHRLLANDPPKELQAKPSITTGFVKDRFGSFYHFESYFNHFSPFFYCSYLYLLAFVLLCVGWLRWRDVLNQAAFWLLVLTFGVHTLALVARIYISGRPPVTNLYSSAVFIGWGVALLALIIELFYRNGLASLTAAASGFVTLLIAHRLAGDGDTFEVLQAVLDTQFWLATHVVCVTFGYATTFLAGMLGIIYIVRGVATRSLDRRTSSELARMIYGTLCFSIFFSFFGTVLGGLWADDSWGRFWGWDPKENGALIIVLWNALILHARWDKMIRERGLAVLSVAGNIVTAWSWFGVNELGIGLHSYGFTEGRLRALALAVLAHLVVIAIGWLPPSAWWSIRERERKSATEALASDVPFTT
jgi:ABC-type transport system involved in cytochrome c biogenesis permease subunit/DNA-binding transcriptional MerR regulator